MGTEHELFCSNWLAGIEVLKAHEVKSTCTERFLTLMT